LRQVVSDLYQRWLADAGAWEQLQAAYEQQKDRLLPAFARFVGKLSEKAGKLVPILGELGGTAIKEAVEKLVVTSEDLRAGRMIVSRLEYTEAKELVSSVHNIAGPRIVLVMDQWEETRDLDQQRNTLRDFLREPEEWPECHILLGAREGSDAAELLEELRREFPGDAYVCMLGEMDLAAETERRRLVSFLHAQPQLRAIENVDDDRVLDLIGGYPRVISRWVADDARETVRTFGGIERLAKEANDFRYSNLENQLLGLDGDRRRLALRITFVPLAEDAEAWRMLRRVILADLDFNALDDLKIDSILDSEAEPPTFGHPTRREAARAFLSARRPEALRGEAEGLVFALARSITAFDQNTVPFAEALVGLGDEVTRQNLGPLPLALCEAAVTFFDERLASSDALIKGAWEAKRLPELGVGFVLAAAFVNVLGEARANDYLVRRDALLVELRALAYAYPDDAAVRQRLAMGLFNTLFDENNPARRDALLDELHALARAHPDEATVHQPLAAAVRHELSTSLMNTLQDAEEDNPTLRDALFAELRGLAHAYPDEAVVREELARGLFHLLVYALTGDDLARRDALLEELRMLARAFPDDAVVRQIIAAQQD
jgi:hypothetical protein